jgi:hypothetical protein
MYIEFQLPTGAGGMAAAYMNRDLNQELHDWADRFNIAYNKKIHKYTVRVTFDDEKIYAFFALTWAPKESWLNRYNLRDPMRIDISR